MYQVRAFEVRRIDKNRQQQLQEVGRIGTRCPHCGHMSWFDLDEPLTHQSILAEPS